MIEFMKYKMYWRIMPFIIVIGLLLIIYFPDYGLMVATGLLLITWVFMALYAVRQKKENKGE